MISELDCYNNTKSDIKSKRKKKQINFYHKGLFDLKLFRENFKDATLKFMKSECKKYGLKQNGSKLQVFHRLEEYHEKTIACLKIQSIFRMYIAFEYTKLRYISKKTHTNEVDFYSLESLKDIKPHQLFSFTCKNGFTYGFDVRSFYMLFKTGKNGKNMKNPYTRDIIPKHVIQSFKRFVRFGKCLKYDVVLKDEEDPPVCNDLQVTPRQQYEANIRDLFFKIDEEDSSEESQDSIPTTNLM